MSRLLFSWGAALLLTGCVGTTGSSLFTFEAAAAGPEDADGALIFDAPNGYHVSLDKVRLRIGATYLNSAVPISGAQSTSCINPGMYVAEVTNELVVDALDPTPQPFPGLGEAIGDPAFAAEVWLTHGDVNQEQSVAPILEIHGDATKDGDDFPFEGTLTIGENRLPPESDVSQPSLHPICKERIVGSSTPILVDITPVEGGSLLLRVDPRGLFTNVDFDLLPKVSSHPLLYRFADEASDPASLNLYRGLQDAAPAGPSHEGVYGFTWQ